MKMQEDEIYPLYLLWLDNKNLNEGAKRLWKMSIVSFNEFKTRYNKDKEFKLKQDNLYKTIRRSNNIDDVLTTQEDDFDDFLNNL